jgi:hypothetical protein
MKPTAIGRLPTKISGLGHVLTTPAVQEESDHQRSVRVRSCIRPLSAAVCPLALMCSADRSQTDSRVLSPHDPKTGFPIDGLDRFASMSSSPLQHLKKGYEQPGCRNDRFLRGDPGHGATAFARARTQPADFPSRRGTTMAPSPLGFMSPMAAAIWLPMRSDARRSGSASRCA